MHLKQKINTSKFVYQQANEVRMACKRVPVLVGSALRPNPEERLMRLYTNLTRLLQKYPEESKYRENTEIIIKFRKSVIEAGKDVQEIEEMMGCGRIDQLILQAERELELVKKLLMYKPWEPLIAHPPEHQWAWPMIKT